MASINIGIVLWKKDGDVILCAICETTIFLEFVFIYNHLFLAGSESQIIFTIDRLGIKKNIYQSSGFLYQEKLVKSKYNFIKTS